MKLTSEQVAAVKHEIGVEPIDADNPAMAALRKTFGDHTFYLGPDGLFVLERTLAETQVPAARAQPAHLVRIASWTDSDKKALQPTPPRVSDTVVDLASATGKRNGAL